MPTLRRRTFASGILPFGSLGTAFAPPSWLSLGSYAGLRSMGIPSLVVFWDGVLVPSKPNGVSRGTGVANRVAYVAFGEEGAQRRRGG